MMEQAPSAAAEHARGQIIHTAPDTQNMVTPPIEQALSVLGLHGRRRELMALLQHRITRGAIIHWRKGRRPAPVWAIKTLRSALGAKRAAIEHVDSLLAAELEKRKASDSAKMKG